ncbi:hypothetical protein [Streptomyces violascens]|uniref:hypothetical protein n=1 Tax=Streptomyces violascens TaxID=67381 RepID=UPI001674DE59|nr:hypothetical protein [Streptomyces violascens]GGU49449.1 hypothetical protein GCM10010289_82460 [Streptomyces violascens]
MSNSTLHASYSAASRAAGALAAALQVLVARTGADPDLARALARIDTTEMKGVLDAAALQAALAEAQAERDITAALAERCRRREAVGATLGTPCACTHSAATHAPRLTKGGRLPCRHTGCGCDDLTFR